jgi:alpha-glucosidase
VRPISLTISSGNDIHELVLEVHYQAKERLRLAIYLKFLSVSNSSQYILPDTIVPAPGSDGTTTRSNSELVFGWR